MIPRYIRWLLTWLVWRGSITDEQVCAILARASRVRTGEEIDRFLQRVNRVTVPIIAYGLGFCCIVLGTIVGILASDITYALAHHLSVIGTGAGLLVAALSRYHGAGTPDVLAVRPMLVGYALACALAGVCALGYSRRYRPADGMVRWLGGRGNGTRYLVRRVHRQLLRIALAYALASTAICLVVVTLVH
jgi:hypothetical protein